MRPLGSMGCTGQPVRAAHPGSSRRLLKNPPSQESPPMLDRPYSRARQRFISATEDSPFDRLVSGRVGEDLLERKPLLTDHAGIRVSVVAQCGHDLADHPAPSA